MIPLRSHFSRADDASDLVWGIFTLKIQLGTIWYRFMSAGVGMRLGEGKMGWKEEAVKESWPLAD